MGSNETWHALEINVDVTPVESCTAIGRGGSFVQASTSAITTMNTLLMAVIVWAFIRKKAAPPQQHPPEGTDQAQQQEGGEG